jgi:hypothetical protein
MKKHVSDFRALSTEDITPLKQLEFDFTESSEKHGGDWWMAL